MLWVAVVPVKALPSAKSRLGDRPDAERAALALAFARDTVAAVLATDAVHEVVVVTSDPLVSSVVTGPRVVLVEEPSAGGLNAALAHGAEHAARRAGSAGVVAVCADLPALRPEELAGALESAVRHRRAFVTDAEGSGTTLLSALASYPLVPAFGTDSAAHHAAGGAVALDGPWPSLRRDVDSAGDLAAAVELGVGRWTAAALGLG